MVNGNTETGGMDDAPREDLLGEELKKMVVNIEAQGVPQQEESQKQKAKIKKMGDRHHPGGVTRKLGEGAQNVAYEVPITIKLNDNERTLNMAVRKRKSESLLDERVLRKIKQQFEAREQLLEKSVPVIPTYRLDEKTGDIYMTNLTLDHGKKQYVLGNISADLHEINQRIEKGDFSEGITNKKELLEILWTIIERCADEKKTGTGLALLESDALFFTIDPESLTAKVLVGDYKYVSDNWGGRKFSQDEMMEKNLFWVTLALKKNYAVLGISPDDAKQFFDAKISSLGNK